MYVGKGSHLLADINVHCSEIFPVTSEDLKDDPIPVWFANIVTSGSCNKNKDASSTWALPTDI